MSTLKQKQIARENLVRGPRGPFAHFELKPPKLKGKNKRLRMINALIAEIMKRHERSNLKKTLSMTCALPKHKGSVDTMSTSHSAVYAFVRTQLRRIFPPEFWGSTNNKDIIIRGVEKLICMRKRETISISYLLRGFKVKECTWLGSTTACIVPSDLQVREQILTDTMIWFCECYIIPLIKSCFFVTEGSRQGNKLLYFRRDVWFNLSRPYFDRLIENRFDLVDNKSLSGYRLGASPLKLIPKSDSFRIITNMRSAIVAGDRTIRRNNNAVLKTILAVLEFEKRRRKDILGSAVTNTTELWHVFCEYKKRTDRARGPFHFYKADIKQCFDSIEQDILIDILQSFMAGNKYSIKNIARGDALVIDSNDLISKPEDERREFKTYSGSTFLTLLQEHIKSNIVTYRGEFYRQKVGIPQGSNLSAILCSFFYGRMEEEYLSFIREDPSAILVRYIDDFLVVSLEEDTIRKFGTFIREGAPKFGCQFNTAKSMTTVDMQDTALCRSEEFPWCGLLFHRFTLNAASDYDRYQGMQINDMMTVNYTPSPDILVHTVTQAIKSKHQPILMDPGFNSIDTVYRNMYESYLLGAVKFSVYCREIWRTNKNRPICTSTVLEVIHRAYNDLDVPSVSKLRMDIRRGLYLRAFIKVLVRRQHLFCEAVQVLEQEQRNLTLGAGMISQMIHRWPATHLERLA